MDHFRFSARAESKPYHCAAFPQHGADHEEGYVRLGHLSGFDNDAWISIEAVRAISREVPEVRLVAQEDYEQVCEQRDALEAELDDVRQQLQQLELEQQAIDLLARKDGQYLKQKRTGRPPKTEKEQVAA